MSEVSFMLLANTATISVKDNGKKLSILVFDGFDNAIIDMPEPVRTAFIEKIARLKRDE